MPVRNKQDLDRLSEINSDMVELRLDYLPSLDMIDLVNIAKYREKLILTVRNKAEGGAGFHEPDEKIHFLRSAIESGFLVDVEALFAEKFHFDSSGQIVSRHFVDHDPGYDELREFVEKYSKDSRIVKVVIRESPESRSTLIRLLNEYSNLAVMEVDGESSSRFLYSMLGSLLLYCHAGEKTSPAQIECEEAYSILELLKQR